jgi:hypothetical protein
MVRSLSPVVVRFVPWRRVTKLSPPAARNEFTVTRYVAAGSMATPFSVIDVIRCPTGLSGR